MKNHFILKLIELYCYVSAIYDSRIAYSVQRFSNNCLPKFTDKEIITIYLWATIQKQFAKKDVYKYAINHLIEYFPNMPSYQYFNKKPNNLHEAFREITAALAALFENKFSISNESIIDSFPIALAKDKRSYKGKVASLICNKGYCATKDFHYYGCKLHVIAHVRPKTTPYPEYALLTPASEHDLQAIRNIISNFENRNIYADKAYIDSAESLHSTSISRIRQPIESLFNQINERVKLQNASKVRSLKGVLTHV